MTTGTIMACPKCGTKNRVEEAKLSAAVCGHCGEKLVHGGDGHPLEVTDENFEREVLGGGPTPVLVDCWAPWCPPCRMLAPIIEQLAGEVSGRFVIAKLNTEENPGIAAQYDIDAIPTMLIFKNGKLVDQIVGLAPKQHILQTLEKHA